MTSQRKVILAGKGPMGLRPSNHIATGGEGAIYRLNQTVVKVFTDPSKLQTYDMVGKIAMLSKIQHPWIVAPKGIVTDESQKPIGYYMSFADGETLPRFFTNDFRAQV